MAPRAASVRVMRSTASAGPDTTVDRGPFTAARLHDGSAASKGGDVVGGHVDGAHRAAGGQLLHQPAARDDESCRVFEGQYLGEDGGGELAHAVADEERGFDAKFEQRRADRVGDGEQSRLGVPGVMDVRAVGEHQVQQPAGCAQGAVDRGGGVRQVRAGTAGRTGTGRGSCRGIGRPARCTAARSASPPPRWRGGSSGSGAAAHGCAGPWRGRCGCRPAARRCLSELLTRLLV